ncbi:MAG: C39 family peptidase [Candidatus Brockarchaeota archaeon]|nr:C39 family peptidase [Candidatus Brockarchaeota archaeon]
MESRKIFSVIILLLILTAGTPGSSPRPIWLLGSPAGAPDLRIVDAVCFPSPIAGFRTTLVVTVENVGDAPASPLVVMVEWGCCQLINRASLDLAAGASAPILFYPLFLHAGEISLKATVDPNNEVGEMNENNNMMTNTLKVLLLKVNPIEPPADLDLGEEQVTWGYGGASGYIEEGKTYSWLPTKEQLPIMRGLPDYNLMGRLDPNNPDSGFESQEDEPACGTTSLAAVLRYLTKMDSSVFHHDDIDMQIRGAKTGEGIWTDPFSIESFASDCGFEARVYVDGDFGKVKWFIDRGIPVIICVNTEGKTGILKGHWVVPVSYWENETLTWGLSSHTMIGYYNPWGYQCAIPQSRFDLYWLEQTLAGIKLWNRVYVAICNKPAPADMPPSNVGGLEKYYMAIIDGFSDCLTIAGAGIDLLASGNPLGIIALLAGAIATVVYGLVVVLPNLIGGWIRVAAEWILDKIRALACDWFGWGCKSKKEYFYYFYSSSPSCECSSFLNDMIRNEAVGYIFTSQVGDTVPVYEYAEVDEQTREVIRYFVSTDPSLPETGAPGVRRFLYGMLGYLPESEVQGVPNEKLVDYLNKYQIGYDAPIQNLWVPQYYLDGSKTLWMFKSSTFGYAFLSPDEAGGTKTFPYVAVDHKGESRGYHFTRDYIVGYVHYNHLRGTVPLYRFYDPDKEEFYLTTDLNDEPEELRPVREMVFSGVVGYIFLEQKPGTVPLYKYRAQEKGAHYLFTTKEIGSDKFTLLGVIGYVYEYEEDCTVPLWLFCFRQVKEE